MSAIEAHLTNARAGSRAGSHPVARGRAALLALALDVLPCSAQTLVFSLDPSGAEVLPPSTSAGFGAGTVVLDREADTLTWRLTVGDLTGTETAAHLHGPSSAGQGAPVLVDLGAGATKDGSWSFPAGLEEALAAGEAYVDVHTDAFPAGELRGQLVRRAEDAAFTLALSKQGAQGSNSPATGSGYLHADILINRLRFGIAEEGLLGKELQTHIHAGAPGVQGPVLTLLPAGEHKLGGWTYPEAEEPGLLSGDTYVNTHTQSFINGEVRGQIEPAATNPQAYCTPKPAGPGCAALASWSGAPTTTGADDLVLAATGLPNQLGAHFFWGASPKRAPFFGGTLCVAGPLVRTPLAATGGTAGAPATDCTGSATFALTQAYMTQHALTAGTLVYGQWWFRDPAVQGASGVGLSDAVQLELRP